MNMVTMEVPASPPEMFAWAKEQNFIFNDVSAQTSITINPGSCVITKDGAIKAVFNHETDGIAYLLGIYIIEKLTEMEKSKEA